MPPAFTDLAPDVLDALLAIDVLDALLAIMEADVLDADEGTLDALIEAALDVGASADHVRIALGGPA